MNTTHNIGRIRLVLPEHVSGGIIGQAQLFHHAGCVVCFVCFLVVWVLCCPVCPIVLCLCFCCVQRVLWYAMYVGVAVVVGVHGAALANLIFTRPDTTAFELSPAGFGKFARHAWSPLGRDRQIKAQRKKESKRLRE